MHKLVPAAFLSALLAGCIHVPPPPNRSAADPADPASAEARTSRYRPGLIASTRTYLNPSVGADAQKMDHSNMPGMDGMPGMDQSQMPPMNGKPGATPTPSPGMQRMPGMDRSQMPGMTMASPTPAKDSGEMPGMTMGSPTPSNRPAATPGTDHSKMPGMNGERGAAPTPTPGTTTTVDEMKKMEQRMKKTSDEMKAKADELDGRDPKRPQPTPPPLSPAPSAAP